MKKKNKRKICTVHDEIIELCDELDELDLNVSKRRDIMKLANYIRKSAVEAKEYGQSMEDRLVAYRKAVETLGFMRDKK